MNSKKIIVIVSTIAIFQLAHGEPQVHSRGEIYRGEPTEKTERYNQRSYQTQSQSQYQNSAYPLYSHQTQTSIVNRNSHPPEYYQPSLQPSPQYYNNPSFPQVAPPQHAYPSYQQTVYSTNPQSNLPVSYQSSFADNKRPAFSSSQNQPYSPNSNNFQYSQKPTFDNRAAVESSYPVTPVNEDFTTRAPPSKKTKQPATTKRPPPSLTVANRFDDRNNAAFKKTLSYDSLLSDNIEKFSLSLLDQFCFNYPDENFMISPYSIYNMLVLIAEGAKGNTLNEIETKLEFGSLSRTRDFQQYLQEALKRNTADVKLSKFSMLVTDRARPVRTEFENTIENTYDAIVEPVMFTDVERTLRFINDFASKKTEGQIPEIVERDDLIKAQLILVSGLFFRGSWMNVFNTTFTRQEPFFDTNGNQIGNVNMMFQRGPIAYSAIADIGCHVLELPYAEAPIASRGEIYGTGLSMIIVLPRKGLSLSQAMANVYQYSMQKIYKDLYLSKLDYEDEEVEVHLPRFDISTYYNVKDILQTLGIKDVFDQSRADLSNINTNYFVSSMIHKTKISVDEKGTTASAVTTSIFANKATPPKFHANKPFLFFIVDKTTNLILFSGQYVQPELY